MTEPLHGWRAWQVVAWACARLLVLERAMARAPKARCGLHGTRPVTHHLCGIHAFEARDEALAYLKATHAAPLFFVRRSARALGIAFGRVCGWGRAVAHTRGWRSEFAYPFDWSASREIGPSRQRSPAATGVEVSPDPTDT